MAKREEKIMIRLSKDIKEQFQMLADEYGMTMSSLAAYLIGNYVRTQQGVLIDPIQGRAVSRRSADGAGGTPPG